MESNDAHSMSIQGSTVRKAVTLSTAPCARKGAHVSEDLPMQYRVSLRQVILSSPEQGDSACAHAHSCRCAVRLNLSHGYLQANFVAKDRRSFLAGPATPAGGACPE